MDQIIDEDKGNQFGKFNYSSLHFCDDICQIVEYFMGHFSNRDYEVYNVGTGLGISGSEILI